MNYYYPHDQFLYSLAMLVVGVITGIFYDLFRIKRKLFGSNNLILFFDDVFFTVAAVMFYLISVFVFNNGIVRWYSGVLCLIGLYAYLHTLSDIFQVFAYQALWLPPLLSRKDPHFFQARRSFARLLPPQL